MADINQIIDPKALETLKLTNKELIRSGEIMDKLIPDYDKLVKTTGQISKSTKQTTDKQKQLTAAQKEAQKLQKQLEQTENKINQVRTQAGKKLLEQRANLQKLTKEQKLNIKIATAQKGAYDKISAALSKNETKWKSLSRAERDNTKAGQQLTKTIQKQRAELVKLDSRVGRSQRNVGNYGSALKGVAGNLLGAFGVVGGVFAFVSVLKSSFGTIRSFTKENAVLAGVLGKTRDEVVQLTEQAVALGSQYPVTASEVTKLQVSFARLGFAQSEIINLTEATIQGSIALNAELDATATLVGALVKAFGNLGTQDSAQIIDVLTLATQRSSLSFESLETALPKVAAAANAVGVSLETVTAQLGIAQDATLDASISGTSLRNIYLELSKTGMSLDEALNQINTSSNRLRTAYDLFGKRAAVVALSLADNTEKTKELEGELKNAGGTAAEVAKEQMATLDGSIKSLQSSWEKAVLGFRNSEGPLRAVIDSLTLTIDTFTNSSISGWRKLVEVVTLGLVPAASKQQKILAHLNKRLATATSEQIKFTIDKNRARLEEEGKFGQLQLDILERSLAERIETERKAEEDAAKRKEIQLRQQQLQEIAIQEETSQKLAEEAQKASEARAKARADEIQRTIEARKEQEKADQEYYEKFDELIVEDDEKLDERLDNEIEKTIEAGERILEEKKRLLNEESQAEREQAEVRQRIREEAFNFGISATNALFDIKRMRLQQELQEAEGNAQKQAQLRAELAKQEKRQALFQVAIDTASAVMRVWADVPKVDFGVSTAILTGLAIAQGAVQAAMIAAQPIPQFAKGTNYSPEGLALVGEKGRELLETPGGQVFMANNPALVNLERGTKVLSNRKTEAYLNDNNIVSELRQTRKAIQKIPQPIFLNSSKIAERRGNYWKNYKANKHRLN